MTAIDQSVGLELLAALVSTSAAKRKKEGGFVAPPELKQAAAKALEITLSEMRRDGFWFLMPHPTDCRLVSFRLYDPLPWDINRGWCDEFADTMVSLLPDADAQEVDDTFERHRHTVVEYEGVYYDALHLDGASLEDIIADLESPNQLIPEIEMRIANLEKELALGLWKEVKPKYFQRSTEAVATSTPKEASYYSPGEVKLFEYHCLESEDSADAELWYRSHQIVTVLSLVEPGGGETQEERAENGEPAVYRVRFSDGFTVDVYEDELSDTKEVWYRPDPPTLKTNSARQTTTTTSAYNSPKSTIIQAGPERVNVLKEKFPEHANHIQWIADQYLEHLGDKNYKYLDWVVRVFKNETVDFKYYQPNTSLRTFFDIVKAFQHLSKQGFIKDKNIANYKGTEQLQNAVQEAAELSRARKDKPVVIYSGPDGTVTEVFSKDQLCSFVGSNGTKWCVTHTEGYWRSYMEKWSAQMFLVEIPHELFTSVLNKVEHSNKFLAWSKDGVVQYYMNYFDLPVNHGMTSGLVKEAKQDLLRETALPDLLSLDKDNSGELATAILKKALGNRKSIVGTPFDLTTLDASLPFTDGLRQLLSSSMRQDDLFLDIVSFENGGLFAFAGNPFIRVRFGFDPDQIILSGYDRDGSPITHGVNISSRSLPRLSPKSSELLFGVLRRLDPLMEKACDEALAETIANVPPEFKKLVQDRYPDKTEKEGFDLALYGIGLRAEKTGIFERAPFVDILRGKAKSHIKLALAKELLLTATREGTVGSLFLNDDSDEDGSIPEVFFNFFRDFLESFMEKLIVDVGLPIRAASFSFFETMDKWQNDRMKYLIKVLNYPQETRDIIINLFHKYVDKAALPNEDPEKPMHSIETSAMFISTASPVVDGDEDEVNLNMTEDVALRVLGRLGIRNFDVLHEMHSGMHGTTFRLPNGKVAKFTDDLSEAKASFKVLRSGSKFPELTKYYDVFGFTTLEEGTIYVIVQEMLKETPETSPWRQLGFNWWSYRTESGDFERKITKSSVEDFASIYYPYNPECEEIQWMYRLEHALRKCNVKYYDLHDNNIMMRGDYPVCIDLGQSDVPGQPASFEIFSENEPMFDIIRDGPLEEESPKQLEILALTLLVQAAGSTPKLLKKQFPENVKEIEELATHDPSGNKYAYLEWMLKQVRNGASVEEVSEKITTFHAIADEFKIPFKAKDLKELDKVIEDNQDKLIEVRTKQGHGQNKDKEPVVLYDKNGYKALEVFRHEDVCELGKGTTWCVSKPETKFFRDYNTPGTRWIFLISPNGERRMAMIRQKHGQKNEDAFIEQLRDEKQEHQKDVGPNDWSRKILDEMGFSAWYGVAVKDSKNILELLKTSRGRKWLFTDVGGWWLSEHGEAWLASPDGQSWLYSPEGHAWIMTDFGGIWLNTIGAIDLWWRSATGKKWIKSEEFFSWLFGNWGGEWLYGSPVGEAWLSSPDGQSWFQSTDGGKKWLLTDHGSDWLNTKKGQAWLASPDGQSWAREHPDLV